MPAGGRLRVFIDKDGDQLAVHVQDSGPGIPAAVHGRLFELFATGRKGGTGLGLAIVKRVVDDHKGTIRCETGPTGTTFVIRLPLQRSQDPSADSE